MQDINQNTPVVVNLSLGGHDGPHDGSSEYEQFYTNIKNEEFDPSLIIVAAAGNEGSDKMHFQAIIDDAFEGNAKTASFISYNSEQTSQYDFAINIWYSGPSIEVKLERYDYDNSQLIDETDWIYNSLADSPLSDSKQTEWKTYIAGYRVSHHGYPGKT